jgi:hypothetical protein
MFTFLTRLGHVFVGSLIAVAVISIFGVGSLTGILVASKQTASTGGTIALDSADPSFGATVKFTASYAPMKWVPEESVICTSNGQMVYGNVQVQTSGSSPWTSSWTLWSQTWANAGGAAASCTASLFYYTWQGKTETGVVYLASSIFTT